MRIRTHDDINTTLIEQLSNKAMHEADKMPEIARSRAVEMYSQAIDVAFHEHVQSKKAFKDCLEENLEISRKILKKEFKGKAHILTGAEKSVARTKILTGLLLSFWILMAILSLLGRRRSL